MAQSNTLEVPIRGMDCVGCTKSVQRAISALPGVQSVDVSLTAEKAVIQVDPSRVDLTVISKAVEDAGYSVPPPTTQQSAPAPLTSMTRQVLTLFGIVFGVVLFVVIVGEWLGFFEAVTERVPWLVGAAIVLAAGYPIFRNVIRSAMKREVTSHTLMSVGAVAALVVGQWATAAVVVFFMRVGDYTEHFTMERARRAVKDLTALTPQTARVERDGQEYDVPATDVHPGEVVVIRPGDKIPVDGEVISGQATIDQAAITGEAMPVEVGPGAKVFAATIARLGSLRVRTTQVGPDTTFGRVIKLVEEAEANKADVQRIGDKFSAYYLPVVAAIAALTFLIRRDPLATAAVLVVACSCSFALATPIAMLASIGAGAKQGLLIKGGKYLETLARADVLLLDKTGTLTLGRPQITDVVPLNGLSENDLLTLAASAERYSEHPLAEAVRSAAKERGLSFLELKNFEAIPGMGVQAQVNGNNVTVGSYRMLPGGDVFAVADELQVHGKTQIFVLSAFNTLNY